MACLLSNWTPEKLYFEGLDMLRNIYKNEELNICYGCIRKLIAASKMFLNDRKSENKIVEEEDEKMIQKVEYIADTTTPKEFWQN